MSYPHLAVRARLLRVADFAELGDVRTSFQFRDAREVRVKLRYLHRNPVKRGLVTEAADWKWSSFRHYAYREMGAVEVESEWTVRDREANRGSVPPRIFLRPRLAPRTLSG